LFIGFLLLHAPEPPNGTELANATWNGYSNGDYHWIEFDELFKLKKNVNYTYEIKTGSYPKYIHNHTLKTSGEEITCLSLWMQMEKFIMIGFLL